MTYIIALDGVLRDERKIPVYGMKLLLMSLNEVSRVVLAVSDVEEAERFLIRERMNDDYVLMRGTTVEVFHQEISRGEVYGVFSADSAEVREVVSAGVTGMLVASSSFMDPRWRPDARTWGQILNDSLEEVEDEDHLGGIGDTQQ